MSGSTAPTSGSASGVYLYENTPPPALANLISTIIADLQATPGAEPVIAEIESLSLVEPVASDTDATFNNGTVTVDGTTYSDSTVVASSTGAFEFQSGGANYILSNSQIGVTLDQFIDGLITTAAGQPATAATLAAFKATIDGYGFGGLDVVSNSSFDTGAPYVPPCFLCGTLIPAVRRDGAVEDDGVGDVGAGQAVRQRPCGCLRQIHHVISHKQTV